MEPNKTSKGKVNKINATNNPIPPDARIFIYSSVWSTGGRGDGMGGGGGAHRQKDHRLRACTFMAV